MIDDARYTNMEPPRDRDMFTHEIFLHKLGGYEGGVGGKRLRLALGWPKDVFDVIRNELKKAGLITVGKGQGGSIESRVPVRVLPGESLGGNIEKMFNTYDEGEIESDMPYSGSIERKE